MTDGAGRSRHWAIATEERAGEGAAGGAMATLAMSALMLAAGRIGLMGRYPPEKLASFTLARLGVGPLARWKADGPLAALLHLAFGASLGAAFSLLPARVRHVAPEPLVGAAFGTLVWLVSYWGWIPTLGVLPPPDRDRADRQISMLVAHWVFGAALGASLLALEVSGSEPSER